MKFQSLRPDSSCIADAEAAARRSLSSGYLGTAFAGATGSEMAHLFYNTLDKKGWCDPALSTVNSCSGAQAGWGLTNSGPFANLAIFDSNYWFATAFAPHTYEAWYFEMKSGYQGWNVEWPGMNAWPVSDGDVGIAAIPEPETYALMLAGLGLIGAMARRRKLAKV